MIEPTVTLSKDKYESLLEDERWRTCVEAAGVDNWNGFSYAMDMFYEGEGDDD